MEIFSTQVVTHSHFWCSTGISPKFLQNIVILSYKLSRWNWWCENAKHFFVFCFKDSIAYETSQLLFQNRCGIKLKKSIISVGASEQLLQFVYYTLCVLVERTLWIVASKILSRRLFYKDFIKTIFCLTVWNFTLYPLVGKKLLKEWEWEWSHQYVLVHYRAWMYCSLFLNQFSSERGKFSQSVLWKISFVFYTKKKHTWQIARK